jgi:hypothetical protein
VKQEEHLFVTSELPAKLKEKDDELMEAAIDLGGATHAKDNFPVKCPSNLVFFRLHLRGG